MKAEDYVDVKILQDFMPYPLYRVGIWACPKCDYSSEFGDMNDDWFGPGAMREVAVSEKAARSKSSGVMISSACTKCFEVSYHHVSFDFAESCADLMDWPKNVVKAIVKEKAKRMTKGKRIWNKTLCKTCSRKKEVTWEHCEPWVKCVAMSGRATKECSKYRKKGAR